MSDISKLTKNEMINYLYVRDIIRGGDDYNEYNNNIIDIMLYTLPVILILIFIIVIYLVFKQNSKKDIKDNK